MATIPNVLKTERPGLENSAPKDVNAKSGRITALDFSYDCSIDVTFPFSILSLITQVREITSSRHVSPLIEI